MLLLQRFFVVLSALAALFVAVPSCGGRVSDADPTACTTASDCRGGQVCVAGACRDVCRSDEECAAGTVCGGRGVCEPGGRGDASEVPGAHNETPAPAGQIVRSDLPVAISEFAVDGQLLADVRSDTSGGPRSVVYASTLRTADPGQAVHEGTSHPIYGLAIANQYVHWIEEGHALVRARLAPSVGLAEPIATVGSMKHHAVLRRSGDLLAFGSEAKVRVFDTATGFLDEHAYGASVWHFSIRGDMVAWLEIGTLGDTAVHTAGLGTAGQTTDVLVPHRDDVLSFRSSGTRGLVMVHVSAPRGE
jgi:hypothetical protein